MRVIETVTDATSLNHLWLRQMTPNLADDGTCAEVAMNYAPIWDESDLPLKYPPTGIRVRA